MAADSKANILTVRTVITVSAILIALCSPWTTAQAQDGKQPPKTGTQASKGTGTLTPKPVPVADDSVEAALKAAGYRQLTFDTTGLTPDQINLVTPQRSGKKLYLNNFLFYTTDATKIGLSNGELTINGSANPGNSNAQIASAALEGDSFVGTVFGGGAYIEAKIRMPPSTLAAQSDWDGSGSLRRGWPSFWLEPIELMLLRAKQNGPLADAALWQGEGNDFVHFVEPDIFEMSYPHETNDFATEIHEWYGPPANGWYTQAPRPGIGHRHPEPAVDWGQYQTVGMLWIPATDTTPGSLTRFFNGRRVGQTLTWKKYENEAPIPDRQPWAFGVMDRHHYVLLLGTGDNLPFKVRDVKVWQASARGNITK
ncbi:hypothetical protein [Oryzibacter oryziterrae]|uniref:hypothetical protein n=1 Tax=Oryzibacter oryziterrae TaxID=2766474 RepID=UPI001F24726D|nr:hypothetical protein [Oryzibacter oryziterrae]